MFVALLVAAAAAQEQSVCPTDGPVDPTCDWPNLWVALAYGGEELRLLPGVHRGPFFVGRGVRLRGEPGARIEAGPYGSFPALEAWLRPADTLIVEDLELDGRSLTPVLVVHSGALEVRGSSIRRGVGSFWTLARAGGIETWGTAVLIVDSELTANLGYQGGALSVNAGSVEVVDSTFAGNRAAFGGAIRVADGALEVAQTLFERNEGVQEGGHLHLERASALVTDATMTDARSAGQGTAIQALDSVLTLEGGVIEGSRTSGSAPYLGQFTVLAERGELSVNGTTLRDNEAGAVGAYRVPSVEVRDAWVCDNGGLRGAGVDLWESCAAGCSVTGTVIQGNLAVELGGAIKLWAVAGPVEIANVTIYANQVDETGSGAAFFVEPSPYGSFAVDAHHNLVVQNRGGGFVIDTPAPPFGWVDNAFVDNDPDLSRFPLDPSRNVFQDQVFFTDGAAPCGYDVHLARIPENDALLDGGYGAFPDDCGSDCVDHDGDGFVRRDDCPGEDDAAEIYPGAPDPPFDGVDQNCDGVDGFDGDGDGVPYRRDCDDEDPEIGECPVWVVGVVGGGGCDQSRGAPSVLALLGLLLARRRRG